MCCKYIHRDIQLLTTATRRVCALTLFASVGTYQGQKINQERPGVYLTYQGFVKKTASEAGPSDGPRLLLHNNTRWAIHYGEWLERKLQGDVAMIYTPGDTALPMNQRQMQYVGAGNLTYDGYTGQGTRTYDAENRMKQAWANGQWQTYAYDGDGRRVKRNVNVNGTQTETWQVYGVNGELLAEYAQNASASSPQKEYGYRNGQLLITAEAGSGSGGSPFVFTDEPLVAGATIIKALHLTELRTAVNQARARAGLGAASWTDSQLVGTVIKAVHITELRTRLDEARLLLGLSPASYTDPGLTAGYTVKAVNVQELRTRTNEALTTVTGGGVDIRWLVTDQLGTPRIIIDKTGSLANVKRHDYLPFGEELFVGTGGRTTGQGYVGDNVRQKFTLKERDIETGLDFFGARYHSSTQGRFTSADIVGGERSNPQSLNLYAYVLNNPLAYTDPTGHMAEPWRINPLDYLFGPRVSEPMLGQDPKKKPLPPTEGGPLGVPIEHPCIEPGCGPAIDLGTVTIRIDESPISTTTDPLPGISAPLIGAGTGAGFGEYSFERGGYWRGGNGNWYPMRWGGNGATGGRSVVTSTAGGFRLFGRFVFAVSAANSLYQGADAYKQGDRQGVFNAGTDIGMGALGTFGGPVGFGGNLVYTGYRIKYPNENPFNAKHPTITNVTPIYMPFIR